MLLLRDISGGECVISKPKPKKVNKVEATVEEPAKGDTQVNATHPTTPPTEAKATAQGFSSSHSGSEAESTMELCCRFACQSVGCQSVIDGCDPLLFLLLGQGPVHRIMRDVQFAAQ